MLHNEYRIPCMRTQHNLHVRGQAESVEPNKRPAYRARLVAARRELRGTAGAYIDSILHRLDELDGAEVAR